ncbi:ArsR/SmtB family transcription factor [Cupriavidus campinensis]
MNIRKTADILGALAQENRLRIFLLLAESGPDGLSAGIISASSDLPPSSVTFHLKELVRTGLVKSRQQGRFMIYSATGECIVPVLDFLQEKCG